MYIVLAMKNFVAILFIILIFLSLIPFTQGNPEKRSLDITSLTITFDRTDAIFTANYDLDTFPRMYILLFGSKNIEPKINSIFSNFNYQIIKMDQDKAILRVKDISRVIPGYYLHDSRKIGSTIDKIYIYTPDSPFPKEYSNRNSTPNTFYRS
jgi:hypothetical protein